MIFKPMMTDHPSYSSDDDDIMFFLGPTTDLGGGNWIYGSLQHYVPPRRDRFVWERYGHFLLAPPRIFSTWYGGENDKLPYFMSYNFWSNIILRSYI